MAATAEQAQARKASVQTLVDKVVSVFVPAVLVISLVTLVVWLVVGGGSAQRLQRRPLGAHHRLPLRAGAGHAHRVDGGRGPRRPARHPDQGTGRPRSVRGHRHRGPRQDRHPHHRNHVHGAGRRLRRRWARTSCSPSPPPWRAAPSTRSLRRSCAPQRPAAWPGSTAWGRSRPCRGRAYAASWSVPTASEEVVIGTVELMSGRGTQVPPEAGALAESAADAGRHGGLGGGGRCRGRRACRVGPDQGLRGGRGGSAARHGAAHDPAHR